MTKENQLDETALKAIAEKFAESAQTAGLPPNPETPTINIDKVNREFEIEQLKRALQKKILKLDSDLDVLGQGQLERLASWLDNLEDDLNISFDISGAEGRPLKEITEKKELLSQLHRRLLGLAHEVIFHVDSAMLKKMEEEIASLAK